MVDWKKLNGEEFSVEDWGDFHLTPELIIGFTDFFFPKFSLFQNGVFFERSIPRLKEQLAEGQWKDLDILGLQYVYNHQHILDNFMGESYDKVTRQQLECVGKILVDVWGLKLCSDFPNLDIHIELQGLESEDDLDTILVFWAEPKL